MVIPTSQGWPRHRLKRTSCCPSLDPGLGSRRPLLGWLETVQLSASRLELLQANRKSIEALCCRYGVARLDVFGSALGDDFRPGESDLDLLIEFGPMQGYQKAVAYFDLLDDLQSLLGVDVDLVVKGALTNPYLAGEIEQSRQLLYAA